MPMLTAYQFPGGPAPIWFVVLLGGAVLCFVLLVGLMVRNASRGSHIDPVEMFVGTVVSALLACVWPLMAVYMAAYAAAKVLRDTRRRRAAELN